MKSVNRERRNVEELFGQTQTTGRAEFFFRREATAAAATAFDPAKTGRPRPPNFWPNLRSHTRPKQSRISLSLSSPHFIVCPGDDVSNLLEIEKRLIVEVL